MAQLLLQEPNASELKGEGEAYVPPLLKNSEQQPVNQRFMATLSPCRSCGSSGFSSTGLIEYRLQKEMC